MAKLAAVLVALIPVCLPAQSVTANEELRQALNLVAAQYQAGHFRETLDLCTELLKSYPDAAPLWMFLGGSHLSLGDSGGAIEPLRKALALQPNDRNARVMLAGALLVERRYEEAIPEFESAARSMPANPRIWFGLLEASDAAATELFQRLDHDAPGSAELYAVAGFTELDRKRYARALHRFRQALALQPKFPGLHAAIAEIYTKAGHPDWARQELLDRSASVFAPNGLYTKWKARRELARKASQHLHELPPSSERYESDAERYERDEQYLDAVHSWKQALALAPHDARLELRLVEALCLSNDCASALPLLKELYARDPASAQINYLYGKALSSMHETAQALPFLEKAVELNGKYLPARGALGAALLEAGNPEQAIPHLEAALESDQDGSRHYQLGRAYQAAGKQEQAAAALREYREILRRREGENADEPGDSITPPQLRAR